MTTMKAAGRKGKVQRERDIPVASRTGLDRRVSRRTSRVGLDRRGPDDFGDITDPSPRSSAWFLPMSIPAMR